jgi:hypothetical protein
MWITGSPYLKYLAGVVVCTCNLSTQKAEAGGLSVLYSEFQASLYSKTMSQKKKE